MMINTGAGHPWLPLDLRMRRWANDGFYEREHYFTNIPSAGIRSTIRLSVALSARHAYRNRAMWMRSSARPSRMRARRCGPLRLESVGSDLGASHYGFRNSIPKG